MLNLTEDDIFDIVNDIKQGRYAMMLDPNIRIENVYVNRKDMLKQHSHLRINWDAKEATALENFTIALDLAKRIGACFRTSYIITVENHEDTAILKIKIGEQLTDKSQLTLGVQVHDRLESTNKD